MVNSFNNPQNIEIDFGTFKNGKIDILVHWNITSASDKEGNLVYNYDEVRMIWILPEPFTSKELIQNYFDNNYNTGENILNWAKASKIQFGDL